MKNQEFLAVHYYFDDEAKHSMDALIKAKADVELLSVMSEVADLFEIQISIKTQALKEGSLIEVFSFLSEFKNAATLIALFGFIFTVYKYCDGKEGRELDNQAKRLNNIEKELMIRKLRKELNVAEENFDPEDLAKKVLRISPKILAKRSSYFRTLMKQNDISKIGFTDLSSDNKKKSAEKIIPRDKFIKMIVEPLKPHPELYENVEIEVISPLLKHQKNSKWKGLLGEQEINFILNDSDFCTDVFMGRVSFTSGTILLCDLEVRKKIDEVGEEVVTGYSVNFVHTYGNQKGNTKTISLTNQNKQQEKKQGDLFI